MMVGVLLGLLLVLGGAICYRWGYSSGREREISDAFWADMVDRARVMDDE